MLAGHIQNGKIIIELAWHARLLCFSDPLSLGVLSPILFPFFMCPTLEEQAATPTSLLFMWQIRSHSSKLIEIWSAAAASSHDYKWGSRDFLLWWSSLEIGLFLTPKKVFETIAHSNWRMLTQRLGDSLSFLSLGCLLLELEYQGDNKVDSLLNKLAWISKQLKLAASYNWRARFSATRLS